MSLFLHNEALGKLVLRLTLGSLILFHGVAKITNPVSVDYIAGALTRAGEAGAAGGRAYR